MRILLDTNVLIAAALGGILSEDIIEITVSIATLVTSEEILTELERKLAIKFHWTNEDIKLFTDYIRNIGEVIQITENVSVVTRDPNDNKILSCAVSGKVDLIVSSDQDLIKLKHFKGIGIIHPKTFSWTFPEYFKKLNKIKEEI